MSKGMLRSCSWRITLLHATGIALVDQIKDLWDVSKGNSTYISSAVSNTFEQKLTQMTTTSKTPIKSDNPPQVGVTSLMSIEYYTPFRDSAQLIDRNLDLLRFESPNPFIRSTLVVGSRA